MSKRWRSRRGVEANIPVLTAGEPGFCTDSYKLFIGSAGGNKEIYPRGVYNAKDYQIFGNGSSDDTAALASLITTADGIPIIFPAGTYIINSLPPASNMKLYGVAKNKVIFKSTTGRILYDSGAASIENVELKNITFNGDVDTVYLLHKSNPAYYWDSWILENLAFSQEGIGSIYANLIGSIFNRVFFGNSPAGADYQYCLNIPSPADLSVCGNANVFIKSRFWNSKTYAVKLRGPSANVFLASIFEGNKGPAVNLEAARSTNFLGCHFESDNQTSGDSEVVLTTVEGIGASGIPYGTFFSGCYFSPGGNTLYAIKGSPGATFLGCYKASASLKWTENEYADLLYDIGFYSDAWSKMVGNLRIGEGARISKHLTATKQWTPGTIPDEDYVSTNITVTGAAPGDTVTCGFSLGLLYGSQLTATVTNTDTVTVTLFNHAGTPYEIGEGTLRADVWKHP